MRKYSDPAELAAAKGEHLGHSPWVEVTQEKVDRFAHATDDLQWIHVDPVRAAESSFGGTIAHGYMTLALLPSMMRSIFEIEGVQLGVNFGLDKVRFPRPVMVGERIRAGAELTNALRTPAGWLISIRMTVESEDADRPACVADTLSLFVVPKTTS